MYATPIPKRILFTFAGGNGHLEPLIPLARAAEARRHSVAFAARPWMVPQVDAAGFPAFFAGSDLGLTPKRLPLAEADLDQDMRDVGIGFGRRIARERAVDILSLCTEWRPDLLVCEEFDFGAGEHGVEMPGAFTVLSAGLVRIRPPR
jgi:hypothetical protein